MSDHSDDERPVSSKQAESLSARTRRLCWLAVIVATILASVAWWWLEPGGFGIGHPRFWANSVAPLAGLGVSLATLAAMRVESRRALKWLLPVWPAAALGSAVAGRLLFPVTLGQLWLIPLATSLVMGLAVLPVWRGAGWRGRAGGLCLGLVVAVTAGAFVWTQYPPVPHTRPPSQKLISIPEEPTRKTMDHPTGVLRLGDNTTVHASEGSLLVRLRPLSISVTPLLTFLNGSKDGCWSVFARARDRIGPEPRLRTSQREDDRSCVLGYEFAGQGPATLRVHAEPNDRSVSVDAQTKLEHTVYSHLNAYCDIEVRGHRRLELEFSPCMGMPVEVRKSDYPIGRPARFAFVEEDRTFRVVEARSGEKGPFHTLARGHLGEEEPLTISLHDQRRLVAKITLNDWSAQADTTLSPTAGWGVPVNAIEFSLVDDQPSSPASIFITLAGTSVGRGWDCVGHNPGTYRNRVSLEAVSDDQRADATATTDRDQR